MRIEIFISIMKAILKGYQEAYNGKYSAKRLDSIEIDLGICRYVRCNTKKLHISSLQHNAFLDAFRVHYKHFFIWGDYLFPIPLTEMGHGRYKYLKSRVDFLESEIKRLKDLQKKGYTHI